MNMQLSVKKTNTFSKQTPPVPNVVGNMFGSKSKVIFKNGLRSVDISKHNFINFASNKEPNYIKFIQKEINKLKQGTIDILKEYKEKWVGMTPNVKIRLNDVFYETYYYNIGLPYLKRLSKKGKPKFQLYYKYDKSTDTAEIIFVDLYHLLIPAANKQIGETKASPEKTYQYYNQLEDKVDIKDFL